MTRSDLERQVAVVLGREVVGSRPLGGGCVADVRELALEDGSRCVAKIAAEGGLDVEAWMLRYLAARTSLPVPAVLHGDDGLLVLEHVPCDAGRIGPAGERDAADHLAALHEIRSDRFGLERDTVIGGLPQPNTWSASWRDFFRDQRLGFMGRRALDAGAITSAGFGRLERLCARLEDYVAEPGCAALIHGDAWAGNVLVREGRVVAYVDPALYYADPEVELAFVTLFSTFGDVFFDRYRERRPIAAGFFETRRHLYNLYPLLVHAVLFGRGYGESADRIVRRFLG